MLGGSVTKARAFFEASIRSDSPPGSSKRVAPSILTQAEMRPSSGLVSLILQFSGRMRGLKDSECGAIGVNRIAGTLLWTIDPPAARLYAVEPVGVEMISLYFLNYSILPIPYCSGQVFSIDLNLNLNRIRTRPSVNHDLIYNVIVLDLKLFVFIK